MHIWGHSLKFSMTLLSILVLFCMISSLAASPETSSQPKGYSSLCREYCLVCEVGVIVVKERNIGLSLGFVKGLKSFRGMAARLSYPATERNKQPILDALKSYLNISKPAKLLEVSSGTGQHVVHFAPHFPNITFQPTEVNEGCLASIKEYVKESGLSNVENPQFLDVSVHPSSWLEGTIEPSSYDYILNVNMMHISDWSCTKGLFEGSSEILQRGGLLLTYGPYAVNGTITPESNVSFNHSLKSQNPKWGLRDIYLELTPLANKVGIQLEATHDLPANNKFLVWQKK